MRIKQVRPAFERKPFVSPLRIEHRNRLGCVLQVEPCKYGAEHETLRRVIDAMHDVLEPGDTFVIVEN